MTRCRTIDAAFEVLLDAVRDNPDEVVAAVEKFAAKVGPDRVAAVLDSVELRLSVRCATRCRLPQAIRDAARAVERVGHD